MTGIVKACGNCRSFCNDPVFLEGTVKGLNAMSSAWASVRADDGLCLKHQRFTVVTGICPDYTPAETIAGLR